MKTYKTILMLIDFGEHPGITDDIYTNNKRYSELQKLLTNVDRRTELYFVTNLPYIKDPRLAEILKMARTTGHHTLEITETLRPNSGDHTIEEVSNHLKLKFDIEISPLDTQIIIGGNNIAGCIANSKQISAVYWSNAGYKTTIHVPLCGEYEQPGINQVERVYYGFQKLYTVIKKHNAFDNISMSTEWHEIRGL